MSETTNYHLILTDDSTTKFKDWREAINGSQNSNMIKIDTALGEKADLSTSVSTTLLAALWAGVDAPYTQTIAVENLKANQNGNISVAHTATAAQREMARSAMLSVIGQDRGTITIAADGEMPDIDIPVVIILLG